MEISRNYAIGREQHFIQPDHLRNRPHLSSWMRFNLFVNHSQEHSHKFGIHEKFASSEKKWSYPARACEVVEIYVE